MAQTVSIVLFPEERARLAGVHWGPQQSAKARAARADHRKPCPRGGSLYGPGI